MLLSVIRFYDSELLFNVTKLTANYTQLRMNKS